MKYNKGFAPITVFLIVLLIVAIGGIAYFAGKSSVSNQEQSTSRPTPSQQYPTSNSQPTTTTNSSLPTALPQYIGAGFNSWPPVITTSAQSYSCNNIGVAPNTEGNDVTAQRVINGKTYCIHTLSDGYAGGRGYTYTYTTSNGNGTKTTNFTLLYQSCGVWQGDGTTKYSECQTAQSTFNAKLDTLIDSLM